MADEVKTTTIEEPIHYDKAEECLIGIMMQDDIAASWILQTNLLPKHFKNDRNKKLFEIVRTCRIESGNSALDDVCEKANNTFVGDTKHTYLKSITKDYIGKIFNTPEDLSENMGLERVKIYAQTILDKYKHREIKKIFKDVMDTDSFDRNFIHRVLSDADNILISDDIESGGFQDGATLLANALKVFTEKRNNPELAKPIPSGFSQLDLCKILLPGRLIVLGGETSKGKSLLLSNITSAALKGGKSVGGATAEINAITWMNRFLCGESKIDATGWKDGKISEEEFKKNTLRYTA
jgi:replicative DNA helicase